MVTRKPKRAEQRALTAARLRTATRHLMDSQGFAKTTIRAIAQHEGVSVGTVMAHFGTKEDLFFEVFYEDLEELSRKGLKLAEKVPELADRLYVFATTLLRAFAKKPHVYGELMRQGLLARGDWGTRFEAQVHEAGMSMVPWYLAHRASLSRDALKTALGSYFALYYFTLLQLLKTDFDGLEQGLASLRAMVDMHVGGLP